MKPIGGRGNKAPYETTHVRIPVDIKPQVEELVEQFRNNHYQVQIKKHDRIEDEVLNKPQEFIKLMIEELKKSNLVIVEQSFNSSNNSSLITLEEAINLSTELLNKRITKKELVNKLLTILYQVEVKID